MDFPAKQSATYALKIDEQMQQLKKTTDAISEFISKFIYIIYIYIYIYIYTHRLLIS